MTVHQKYYQASIKNYACNEIIGRKQMCYQYDYNKQEIGDKYFIIIDYIYE